MDHQIESWHRRRFLQGVVSGGIVCGSLMSDWLPTLCLGAEQIEKLLPLRRFPRMTQDWLVDRVRNSMQRSKEVLNNVKTPDEAQTYVESCRARAKMIFGPSPEKTPLNAKTVKRIERDKYWIENVVFQSRPEFYVTANLYVPKDTSGKLPGVIGTCGHSHDGKANRDYQSFAQGLARQGYVVLIYDPIGQGERLQYLDDESKSRYSSPVGEHLQMGNQQSLVGEFFGQWLAWDGIRAIDYLVERPEVDAARIGITGNSGGGTQATWICSLDDRIAMAAPACFVTSFLRNAENELPADTEQCPPKALLLGMDHCDFLMSMAPKPLLLLAKEGDYFDVRGTMEAFERLKHVYRLLGKEDHVRLVIGDGYHGYTQNNREAMLKFFCEHSGRPAIDKEPDLTIESEETLRCTASGSVQEFGSKTVATFTREKANRLIKARSANSQAELSHAIHKSLSLPLHLPKPIDYRILRDVGTRNYPTEFYCTYAVETDLNSYAIVTMLSQERWMSRPAANGRNACLYLSHRSADKELREDEWLIRSVKENAECGFFACDVRGIGESLPETCGLHTFEDAYGSDYFQAAHGLMLGRPVLGQRVLDALGVIDWLVDHGFEKVHILGKGWGAIVATFAAVLSHRVHRVALKHSLESYQSIADSEDYRWPYSMLIPNVLEEFDLPDCYRILQAKGLSNVEPWTAKDGMKP